MELGKKGPIPLGGAVVTGSGRLPQRAIIHVAGISMFWRASERSIRDCVRSAMALVQEHQWKSVAFPVIGAGSGGFNRAKALEIMKDEFARLQSRATVIVVDYEKRPRTG